MTEIRTVSAGVYSSGQPSPEELAYLGREGLRTIINLRPPSEAIDFDERATADRLGLRYVSIPIIGAVDLTLAIVSRFADALADARNAGPVLVHCASGNRVGALMALEQGWIQAANPTAALALGRSAGLTTLEAPVAELLTLPLESGQIAQVRCESGN